MKFRVIGADRGTGQDIEVVLEADDEVAAEAAANNKNILVEWVERVSAITPDVPPTTHGSSLAHPVGFAPASRQAPPVPQAATVNVAGPRRGASLGVAGLVLGIVALLICWIPFVGVLGAPLGALGLALAVAGLVVALTRETAIGFPVAGIGVAGLALAFTFLVTGIVATAPRDIAGNTDDAAVGLKREVPADQPGSAPIPEPPTQRPRERLQEATSTTAEPSLSARTRDRRRPAETETSAPPPERASRRVAGARAPQRESVAPERSVRSVGQAVSDEALSTQEIVSRVDSAVFLVFHSFGHGSAFAVDRHNALIATNFHVVAGAASQTDLRIVTSSGKQAGAQLVYCDPKYDLALLKCDLAAHVDPIPLQRDAPEKGADVTVIGSPATDDTSQAANSVTRGIVSGHTTIDDVTYCQIDAAVNPGNSGGPALDNSGGAIGVVTLKLRDHEGIAYVVPAGQITRALNSAHRGDARKAATLVFGVRQVLEQIYALLLLEQALLDCFAEIEDEWGTAIVLGTDITEAVLVAVARHATAIEVCREHLSNLRKLQQTWAREKILPRQLNRSLANYRRLVDEFCTFAENPIGSYNAFQRRWPNKLTEMRSARETVIRRLKEQLDKWGFQGG